jgi:hypothetical protein
MSGVHSLPRRRPAAPLSHPPPGHAAGPACGPDGVKLPPDGVPLPLPPASRSRLTASRFRSRRRPASASAGVPLPPDGVPLRRPAPAPAGVPLPPPRDARVSCGGGRRRLQQEGGGGDCNRRGVEAIATGGGWRRLQQSMALTMEAIATEHGPDHGGDCNRAWP